jgi:hypothetical protein
MAKTTITGLIPLIRPTEASTNYKCPTVSDDDDHPSLSDLPKSILLANAYLEYLNLLNIKSV